MRINIKGMVSSQETQADIMPGAAATISTTSHRQAVGISHLTLIMLEVLLVVAIMITMKNLNINHRKERRLADR